MKKWQGIFLPLVLAGCSPPTVPDITYFRLPPPNAEVGAEQLPSLPIPLVVEMFTADGIYAEQALLYSTGADASALRSYHYQLWTDPPARLLQRRLIDQLQHHRLSNLIADRLTSNIDALRVSTLIRRFERVKQPTGWVGVVQLQFRVDRGESEKPLLLKTYSTEIPAAGEALSATVQSLAKATDQLFAEFETDLRALKIH